MIKRNMPRILALFILLSLSGQVAVTQEQKPSSAWEESGQKDADSLSAVDKLMESRTVSCSERAIKGYEALLKKDPGNPELLCRIAYAYITIITIQTAGLIEERDEFKPVLKNLGKIAHEYADKAYRINPKSKEFVAVALVASGYYTAGLGFFKAMCKGAPGHYKDLAEQLIRLDDKFEGALAYNSLGKYFHMAPWPVGSSRKALRYFMKAVETDPRALQSHYYLGVLCLRKGDRDRAKKEFAFVAENPPHPSESFFISAYKEKAREYLQQIARKKKG